MPVPAAEGMIPRTVYRDKRHTSRNRRENFMSKHLTGVARVGSLPGLLSENPRCGDSQSKDRSTKNDQPPRRVRLLFRNVRRIENLYGRNLFCFLDFGHFVFLGQDLED